MPPRYTLYPVTLLELPGLQERAAECEILVTPVPDTDTVTVGLEALLVTVTLPEVLPGPAGVKVTLKLVVWPAPRVRGVERTLALKAALLTAGC